MTKKERRRKSDANKLHMLNIINKLFWLISLIYIVAQIYMLFAIRLALSVFLISVTDGPVGMMVLHVASADFLVLAGVLPFCIISGRQDAEFFGSLSALLTGYMLVVLSCI